MTPRKDNSKLINKSKLKTFTTYNQGMTKVDLYYTLGIFPIGVLVYLIYPTRGIITL